MFGLRKTMEGSPAAARVAPFVIFVVLLLGQGRLGAASLYWVYLLRSAVGAYLIWLVRPLVAELRWKLSWEAIVAGVGVFVMWVGLDGLYPYESQLWIKLGLSHAPAQPAPLTSPFAFFGEHSVWAWVYVVGHIAGMTFIVPPLEEVFYRSFLYRYLCKANFTAVPLGCFQGVPFLVTSVLFGFEHEQWLPGILCGFAYQWLAIRKNRLGDAMTAHAITNFILGVWIVWRHAWQFW